MVGLRSLVGKFLRRPLPSEGPLTEAGLLASDLWLDQPDALERIEVRRQQGQIDASQAEGLARFAREGYLTLSLDAPRETYEEIDQSLARLWSERPKHVAYAYHSVLKPMSSADETSERKPSYRIADFHAYSPGALELYLDRRIFESVELILGEPAVATQSLYFEYGSQQAMHRDPVFVQTQPPSHLVAAWIALEDIDPQSGPLVYVPGSHRLPYYQLASGEHRFDHRRHGDAELKAMGEFDRSQLAEHGMSTKAFTPRRGEALIWHHSLLHGGSTPENPDLTRKSLVVHFSTRAHYRRLKQTYLERLPREDGFVERPRIVETERLLEKAGRAGFASPLAEMNGRSLSP